MQHGRRESDRSILGYSVVDFDVCLIGFVIIMLVSYLGAPNEVKLALLTHKLSPNLIVAPPTLHSETV